MRDDQAIPALRAVVAQGANHPPRSPLDAEIGRRFAALLDGPAQKYGVDDQPRALERRRVTLAEFQKRRMVAGTHLQRAHLHHPGFVTSRSSMTRY